jgi:YXWGXW repeat-containing protein
MLFSADNVPEAYRSAPKPGAQARRTMKAKWVLGSVLAASTFIPSAFGQVSIGVTIGTPPPPIQYEVPPPMPQVGYVWAPGYWAPYGGRYVWHRGYWAHPPYYGAAWRPARWVHEGPGWRYYEGGWGPHVVAAPPPPTDLPATPTGTTKTTTRIMTTTAMDTDTVTTATDVNDLLPLILR